MLFCAQTSADIGYTVSVSQLYMWIHYSEMPEDGKNISAQNNSEVTVGGYLFGLTDGLLAKGIICTEEKIDFKKARAMAKDAMGKAINEGKSESPAALALIPNLVAAFPCKKK